MKKEALNEIIRETELLSGKVFGGKPDKVVLLESYARVDFDSESDFDIAISLNLEESELKDYYENVSIISSEISIKYGILISILLISNKTFQAYKDVLPLYQNLIREGREYYG